MPIKIENSVCFPIEIITQNEDSGGSSVPSLMTKATPQALLGSRQSSPRAKIQGLLGTLHHMPTVGGRAVDCSAPSTPHPGPRSRILWSPPHHFKLRHKTSMLMSGPPGWSVHTQDECSPNCSCTESRSHGESPGIAHCHTVTWTPGTPEGRSQGFARACSEKSHAEVKSP